MQGWVNAQHCLLMYGYRNFHASKLCQTAWALAVKIDVMRHYDWSHTIRTDAFTYLRTVVNPLYNT